MILDNLKIILKPTGIDNHSTIYPKNNRFIKWQDIDHFEKDINNNTIYGVKKNSEVFTIFLGMSAGKVLDNANKIYEYFQKYQNSNQNRL